MSLRSVSSVASHFEKALSIYKHTNANCVVVFEHKGTGGGHGASVVCPTTLSPHLSLLGSNLFLSCSKWSAGFLKAASECDFLLLNKEEGNRSERLQMCPFCAASRRADGVSGPWNRPQKEPRHSSSPWLRTVIACIRCLPACLVATALRHHG